MTTQRNPFGEHVQIPDWENIAPLLAEQDHPTFSDSGAAEGDSRSHPLEAALNDWNTIPGNILIGCRPNLLVDVQFGHSVPDLLIEALRHVLVACPSTKIIVFHVRINYNDWIIHWRRFFPCFAAIESLGVAVRVSRGWVSGSMYFVQGGAPCPTVFPDGSAVWNTWAPERREKFRIRLWLLAGLHVPQLLDVSAVRLHTGQPAGYAGPDFSFGCLKGAKIDKWRARIYWDTADMHIGFPANARSGKKGKPIIAGKYIASGITPWRPEDDYDFFLDPHSWIKPPFP